MDEIPIAKSQIPNNIQFPNPKRKRAPSFGHFDFGYYLRFGAWDLVLENPQKYNKGRNK
jgi:hypothetical protein